MHLGLTKSRDDKLLQDLLDKKLRVIVIFEDDYLNHIARIAYKDIQQDNYTYRIGEYNIYKGEEWGFCDFCKRHDCYFIVPNETIESGSSEIPKDLEEAARQYFENPKNSWEVRDVFVAAAKWDRKQMMKEGLDAVKTLDFNKVEKTIAGVFVKYGMDRQKEQMMKEAVEGYVTLTLTGVRTVAATIKEEDNIGPGDKVRVIIIKKED